MNNRKPRFGFWGVMLVWTVAAIISGVLLYLGLTGVIR